MIAANKNPAPRSYGLWAFVFLASLGALMLARGFFG